MSPPHPETAEAIREAFPLPPLDLSNYVTRIELTTTVKTLETKIENTELKQRNWVLGGCIALLLGMGGSWITLYSKIDRMAEDSKAAVDTLNKRAIWMQRQDEIDRRQDAAIQLKDEKYIPLPYREPTM